MSLQLAEINSASKKKDFGRLEDGNHLARIVSVIDFGLQPQTDYNTKEKIDSKKIVTITFETPDEQLTYTKDGEEVTKPRWISKDYTLSMHEMAALYKLVKAIKPDCSSLDELLNVPCMINVGSTSGGKAKIVSVSKPMKGSTVGELENDSFHFDFDNPSKELYDGLLDWQKKKLQEADNFPDSPLADLVSGGDNVDY